MLKIRLKRIGRKHDPSFRIVVTEATAPPKGKYKEAVGFYNSVLKQLKLNTDRIKYWLSVGAQPTDVVHNILVKEGVIKGKKKAVHSTRVRKKGKEEEKGKELKKQVSAKVVSEEEENTETKKEKEDSKNSVEEEKKSEVKDETVEAGDAKKESKGEEKKEESIKQKKETKKKEKKESEVDDKKGESKKEKVVEKKKEETKLEPQMQPEGQKK